MKADRILAVDGCPVLQNLESLAIQNMKDFRMQIVDSANSEVVSMRCAEKLLSKLPEVRMQRLNESMQVATAFDTRTLMLMKKFSELCSDTFNVSQSLTLALEFGNTFDSSGNKAIQIGRTVSSSPFVFNLLLCLLNMNVIWERLSRVSETNHTVRDVCLKIDRSFKPGM